MTNEKYTFSSPSRIIRLLRHYYKVIIKINNHNIGYTRAFDEYMVKSGDRVGNSTITKADINLLNSGKEVLERNRGGVCCTEVRDEMNNLIDLKSVILFHKDILYLSQAKDHV